MRRLLRNVFETTPTEQQEVTGPTFSTELWVCLRLRGPRIVNVGEQPFNSLADNEAPTSKRVRNNTDRTAGDDGAEFSIVFLNNSRQGPSYLIGHPLLLFPYFKR
ncbi:hypothetical protein AAG570_004344 [Ranatra chinensis]|uniref:Uncharacterized protein n=1 Tax=Ranatra chinensis TaxID=642074 RepID=A0ABD0Y0L8_9HEMI